MADLVKAAFKGITLLTFCSLLSCSLAADYALAGERGGVLREGEDFAGCGMYISRVCK